MDGTKRDGQVGVYMYTRRENESLQKQVSD